VLGQEILDHTNQGEDLAGTPLALLAHGEVEVVPAGAEVDPRLVPGLPGERHHDPLNSPGGKR
jgi:hypothetical protein